MPLVVDDLEESRIRPAPGTVAVVRGSWVESVHRVHVVVADARGSVIASVGDPDYPTFLRSAAKPLQALPLVEDGVAARFGLDAEDLALCCASHNSEERHVEVARRILARAGVSPDALACGGHPPLRAAEGLRLARDGRRPGPLESNCSGKHAGMLALAAFHGWPLEGYHEPRHPVQRRMAREISRWTGLDEDGLETAVDGCGVVCFRVPLSRLAGAFASFAEAASRGEGAGVVVKSMVRHPDLVAGRDRLDTAVMRAASGRVFAKVGAEGVHAAGAPGEALGVAVKVEDGARRAADVALVRVLDGLGLTRPQGVDEVAPFRRPALRNTRDEIVGWLEAGFEVVPRA